MSGTSHALEQRLVFARCAVEGMMSRIVAPVRKFMTDGQTLRVSDPLCAAC